LKRFTANIAIIISDNSKKWNALDFKKHILNFKFGMLEY